LPRGSHRDAPAPSASKGITLTIDPDLVRRFSGAVKILTGGSGKIGLAVSGGPDSLALLLLAHSVFPNGIAAATVDHGLRPEAADEAHYVAKLCAERSIDHSILSPSEPITGNIQSAARNARYALLQDWADQNGCDWIATAHHADDQLETMLMRLNRGSGVDGLSGIRAANGQIIRPLLGFTKAELIAVCDASGVIPVQDPSNMDTDFDRVKMRQFLASAPHPFDSHAFTNSASALALASTALAWITQHLLVERITQSDTGVMLDPAGLPSELQRRLLHHALTVIEPGITPRGDAVQRTLDALARCETVTLGNVLCKGGPVWHFTPAPVRGSNFN
jgi:tRNA(Ile)-lysidine synthase